MAERLEGSGLSSRHAWLPGAPQPPAPEAKGTLRVQSPSPFSTCLSCPDRAAPKAGLYSQGVCCCLIILQTKTKDPVRGRCLFVLLFCLDCNPGDYRISRSKINKGFPFWPRTESRSWSISATWRPAAAARSEVRAPAGARLCLPGLGPQAAWGRGALGLPVDLGSGMWREPSGACSVILEHWARAGAGTSRRWLRGKTHLLPFLSDSVSPDQTEAGCC